MVHGVRYKKDLAYYDRFTKELPEHEYLGDLVKEKLIYYPIVSREEYVHHGRLTDLMRSGKLFEDIGLPKINPQDDRAMLCGSPAMLKDTCSVLDEFGLTVSPKTGVRGDYLIERASSINTTSATGRLKPDIKNASTANSNVTSAPRPIRRWRMRLRS